MEKDENLAGAFIMGVAAQSLVLIDCMDEKKAPDACSLMYRAKARISGCSGISKSLFDHEFLRLVILHPLTWLFVPAVLEAPGNAKVKLTQSFKA